jgi:hypothetical protein
MNVLTFLQQQNFNGLTDQKTIREVFYKRYIQVSYETPKENTNVCRYIFTCVNASIPKFGKINQECNGLIIEYNGISKSWTPLVIPTFFPKKFVNNELVNGYLSSNQYNVYYTEDGTMFNLYYYETNKKWIISTAKGIDVNENIFNNLTYNQMLNESLNAIGVDTDVFFNNLNKNTCYTFGFKHPDMHPHKESDSSLLHKVWFVQSVIINNNASILNNNALLNNNVLLDEETEPFIIVKKSPLKKIPTQKSVELKVSNLGYLYGRLKKSFDDFANGKRPALYGFILRAKDNSNIIDSKPEYAAIILESSLMAEIRHIWYDSFYSKFIKERAYNRIDTILLNTYLDNKRAEVFSILFPEFRSKFEPMIKMETMVVKVIHDKILNIDQDITSNSNYSNQEFCNIIDIFVSQVTALITLSSTERPIQKIHDIIHNPINIDIFYKLLGMDLKL